MVRLSALSGHLLGCEDWRVLWLWSSTEKHVSVCGGGLNMGRV